MGGDVGDRSDAAVSSTIGHTFQERLSAAAAADLGVRGVLHRCRVGEIVFVQGERTGRFAVVEEGALKATASLVDGRTTLVGVRRAGDVIGLLEVMDPGPRSSTVTALSPALLRVMLLVEIQEVLRDHESARLAAAAVLGGRIRDSIAARLRSADAAPVRLAAILMDFSLCHGEPHSMGAVTIDLPLTQDDLAQAIGASRDSVAKTLMAWRRMELVETRRRRITIVDPVRLGALAEGRC